LMNLRAVGLSFAAIGLILIGSGLVLGSTERMVVEKHSWRVRRLTIIIQPNSYATIQLNGTRSYTYWRSFWQPEVRSTWGWDHLFYWDVNVTSGRMLYLQLSEPDFKCWSEREPRCALVEGIPTGGFGAYNTTPQWRWWIKDPGNPVIVLINNGTTKATAEASVAEFWPQFMNMNVQNGLALVGLGSTLSITGVVFWRSSNKAKGENKWLTIIQNASRR
jgi:hypothetical protein